ncbi:Hypothetical predicted protein, partial [Lynx pardinus]
GEQREKERARRAEFLNGRTDATSPSPGRTPAPREAGSRERGSRAGGRGHRAASPPPRSRGWASGSSGLGPVSPSSWATTLAFRLLTWGGWVLVTLPPAFLHSWARAAASTTDSSRAPASRRSPEGALAGHRDAPANEPNVVPPSPAAQPRTLSGNTTVLLILSCKVLPSV